MAQATILLVEDYKQGAEQPDVAALRKQLEEIPGLTDAEVVPQGRSTVSLTVTARNQREHDKLKALADQQLTGWHVIEPSSYALPKTF